MPELTLDQAIALATQQHRNGRLEQAESIYRQILSHSPNNKNALHYLGLLRGQQGHVDEGIELISRALAIDPSDAGCLNNLAELLRKAGRTAEAIDAGRRAVELRPDYFEGHNNLGIMLREAGELEAAIFHFRTAVQIRVDSPIGWKNLGNALRETGRIEESIDCYRRLAEMMPRDAQVFYRLGLLQAIGCRFDDAIVALRRAVDLDPQLAEAHTHLGAALWKVGRHEEAMRHLQRAVELNPRFARAYVSLGFALELSGKIEQAVECFEHALKIEPTLGEAHSNLASAMLKTGDVEASLQQSRRAVELRPNSADLHSNLIFGMHFSPHCGAQAILAETRRFAEKFESPLRDKWPPHSNDADPDRRLRVGFVSGDFRMHPLACCVIPLLNNRDRSAMEVFCYANVEVPDDVTAGIQTIADHWGNIRGRFDEAVADEIRNDRIDVLVDLSLHTADNRLPLMARKPAPVQATFLAYPGGTGLSAIDYRITDGWLDPPGNGENDFVEKPIRLRHCYWCYQPLIGQEIDVAPPPVLESGHVTFGCLNKFAKISADAQEVWTAILNRTAGSRLILNAEVGRHRQALIERFEKKGIDSGRVEFIGRQHMSAYMQTYARIDIALDPFPFCGGITTCDALWMGVPVVTLRGPSPISRGGCSILNSAGLPELVAGSSDDYVKIAVGLAEDTRRLSEMRAGMRQRLRNSPVMDGKGYAADVEAALRQMWQAWCAGRKQSGS